MNNVIYSEEVFFLFDFGFFGRKGKRKGGRGGGKGRKRKWVKSQFCGNLAGLVKYFCCWSEESKSRVFSPLNY
jgi:hypothetical protein